VRRLVLLSGRGEYEAQRSEAALQASSADWTIVRCSWFAQNFSEGFLLEPILAGEVALPNGDVPEPFVDTRTSPTLRRRRSPSPGMRDRSTS